MQISQFRNTSSTISNTVAIQSKKHQKSAQISLKGNGYQYSRSLLSQYPNIVQFGSAGGAMGAGFYYLTNKNNTAAQPIQYGYPNSVLNGGQFNHSPNKGTLKFGDGGITLLGWLASSSGGHIVSEGLKALTTNFEAHEKLQSSIKFSRAQHKISLAKQFQGEDQKEYIRDAEKLFSDAAVEFNEHYNKAECYKYAAICAKMGERDRATIIAFADLAMKCRQDAWKDIKEWDKKCKEDDSNSARMWVTMPLWLTPMLVHGIIGNRACGEVCKHIGGTNYTPLEYEEKIRIIKEFKDSDIYYEMQELKEKA